MFFYVNDKIYLLTYVLLADLLTYLLTYLRLLDNYASLGRMHIC